MKKPSANRFHVALACTALGLSLCAGGIAVAQTASPPAASADVESKQPGTDAIITGKVKAELTSTEGIPSNQIEVNTQDGTVSLTGLLDNKDQVRKAVAAAKSVRGVHEVNSTGLRSKE